MLLVMWCWVVRSWLCNVDLFVIVMFLMMI